MMMLGILAAVAEVLNLLLYPTRFWRASPFAATWTYLRRPTNFLATGAASALLWAFIDTHETAAPLASLWVAPLTFGAAGGGFLGAGAALFGLVAEMLAVTEGGFSRRYILSAYVSMLAVHSLKLGKAWRGPLLFVTQAAAFWLGSYDTRPRFRQPLNGFWRTDGRLPGEQSEMRRAAALEEGRRDFADGFGRQTLPAGAKKHPEVERVLLAEDYYQVLGTPRTASDQELSRCRNRVARLVHPDKLGPVGHSAAQRVNSAYNELTSRRRVYDAHLEKIEGRGAPDDRAGSGGAVLRLHQPCSRCGRSHALAVHFDVAYRWCRHHGEWHTVRDKDLWVHQTGLFNTQRQYLSATFVSKVLTGFAEIFGDRIVVLDLTDHFTCSTGLRASALYQVPANACASSATGKALGALLQEQLEAADRAGGRRRRRGGVPSAAARAAAEAAARMAAEAEAEAQGSGGGGGGRGGGGRGGKKGRKKNRR
ncbi:hypothetical protein Rsub_01606 [Raphidocelis subcapitata]|uniref:J domain-containing protein n=1 Tax=Raphidocelis subcapitata TaxID=307507 RepID=A0A2V0NUU1_9CHLO|nr:hypothetical protein Rsub_01606 [Raphidocelis subcapitata]|eukprot:GBF88707.1 hypothetical protein Rsub_01606 [Raphidocelis subcapitata]